MSETELIDDSLAILVLVSGALKDGTSHYAYASIPPSQYWHSNKLKPQEIIIWLIMEKFLHMAEAKNHHVMCNSI